MNERRVIRAFGDAFAGSLARAMGETIGTEPPVVIPMKCYWCVDNVTDAHDYKGIGRVPVCDYCKKLSVTLKDKAIKLLNAVWVWCHE